MTRPGGRARPITSEWLTRAAAHYLERYATTRANLHRVLERKVRRRAQALGEPPEPHFALIDSVVERFVALGLLDDEAYAEAKLASLRRQGASGRRAAAKLAEKGVERETLDAVMARDEADDDQAAERYARRRKLGPYRMRERAERRDRDLAAMMRAGFAFALAARVIDREDEPEGGDANGPDDPVDRVPLDGADGLGGEDDPDGGDGMA